MSYASAALSDAPKGFWSLGEAAGTFADTSGNGNNSTGNAGTVTYGQPSLMPDGSGTSIRLNGVWGTYVSLPTAIADWSLAFTLSWWMKKNSEPNRSNIMGKNQDSGNYAYIVLGQSPVGNSIKPSNTGNASTSAATNGVIYHYACTVTAGTNPTILWYRNGIPDGGGVVTTARNNAGSHRLGSTPDSFWGCYDGWLQNYAAFDKVLTANQILSHYNAAFWAGFVGG